MSKYFSNLKEIKFKKYKQIKKLSLKHSVRLLAEESKIGKTQFYLIYIIQMNFLFYYFNFLDSGSHSAVPSILLALCSGLTPDGSPNNFYLF